MIQWPAMATATATLPLAAQHRRGRLFVALAAVAWSTAGILQREVSAGVATQLAGRAFFAVLGLLAYIAVAERGGVARAFRAVGRGGLVVAALMAISSGSFIIALNHASVASILFMQALAPLLAAALGMLLGEPVPGERGSRWRSRWAASRSWSAAPAGRAPSGSASRS